MSPSVDIPLSDLHDDMREASNKKMVTNGNEDFFMVPYLS